MRALTVNAVHVRSFFSHAFDSVIGSGVHHVLNSCSMSISDLSPLPEQHPTIVTKPCTDLHSVFASDACALLQPTMNVSLCAPVHPNIPAHTPRSPPPFTPSQLHARLPLRCPPSRNLSTPACPTRALQVLACLLSYTMPYYTLI